jgi:hypothetical protein
VSPCLYLPEALCLLLALGMIYVACLAGEDAARDGVLVEAAS